MRKKLLNLSVYQKCVILFFAFYLVLGLVITGDYGISMDERVEHRRSLRTYSYMFSALLKNSKNAGVLKMFQDYPPELSYYGFALQGITVAAEHLTGFSMSTENIIYMRHIFTFLCYFLSSAAFYAILRKRFPQGACPLLGAFLYAACPRIFAESFYNIKDVLFLAWFTISVCFLLLYLENRRLLFLFSAALTSALATNARILGVSLVLLTVFFGALIDLSRAAQGAARRRADIKTQIKQNILTTFVNAVKFLGAFFVIYVIITPMLWANPFGGLIDTLKYFKDYVEWDSTHLYLGRMISRHVPWHYLIVWMGVTLPVLYIAAFLIGTGFLGAQIAARANHGARFKARPAKAQAKNPRPPAAQAIDIPLLYDAYFLSLFFCTLLGYIVLKISVYESWRHAYSLFCPFAYIAAAGFYFLFSRRGRVLGNKYVKYAIGGLCAFLLSAQVFWLVKNHPYQYVYFNEFARGGFAEKNFCLDYWDVSFKDLLEYAFETNDAPALYFNSINSINAKKYYLPESQKQRVWPGEYETADFYVTHTRAPFEDRFIHPEFTEIKSINVDNMKISALSAREPIKANIDPDAYYKISRFENSASDADCFALFDGDFNTYQQPARKDSVGYMLFEFAEPVDYTFLGLRYNKSQMQNFPREIKISASADGGSFTQIPFTVSADTYFYLDSPGEYKYLKIEGSGGSERPFRVCEMNFGHTY